MISRSARPRERNESREIVELRELRQNHPELAPAVDLQLEILELHRRVTPRLSLPAALLGLDAFDTDKRGNGASTMDADGKFKHRPLLTWSLVPIEWSEFRAVLRETIDLLLRSGNIEVAEAQFLTAIARDGNRLPAFIEAWFRQRIEGDETTTSAVMSAADIARIADASLDNALSLAFRPFLIRCADAIGPRLSTHAWQRGCCPLCGGDPELAIVSDQVDHTLVCARCTLRWPFPEHRCPFCDSIDPDMRRTFASPERTHRLLACDGCQRYLKAYDERFGRRPSLPTVDVIAMLPLDALAIQRGYLG